MSWLRLITRTSVTRTIASIAAVFVLAISACTTTTPCPAGGCPPTGPVPPLCSPGQTNCNGVCVDLSSDPANCATCGVACGAGLFCSASTCSSTCNAPMTVCGVACVDTMTSAAYCGNCTTACQPGAACTNGVCGAPPAGTGGATGVGGTFTGSGGGSGAVTGSGGGSGAAPGSGGAGGGSGGTSNSLLGGYHVHGDWAGFAFTFVDTAMSATISPASFETMIDTDGPYCVTGSVVGTPPDPEIEGSGYTSIAAVGFNTNQPKIEDAPTGKVATTGDGVLIHLTVNSGETMLRVQLEDGTDPMAPDAAQHRWCANLDVVGGEFNETLPWEAFSTECWAPGGATDSPFDPATQLAKVIIYVPDPGTAGTTLPFDYCVHDIGPSNVVSRGTGTIGAAGCGQNVTWSPGSVGDQYGQASSSGGYQFQNNGWGWTGGGSHSSSLNSGNGFTLTSQSCSRTDSVPCSFPSVYIGTDADGTRSSHGGLPKLLSSITSAPTCMGWSNGGTPSSHEFNVSYDVWFNTNAQATSASKFLMVWYRDPPSFQPGGMTPIATAVIGDQNWQVWHGPNASNQPVTSYVSMAAGGLAQGQSYSFNLKDFFDDATERGYLVPASDNLIAVMGGMEIWGGGQGASINGFSATVQ